MNFTVERYEMACLSPPWRASGIADLVRQICGSTAIPVPKTYSRIVADSVVCGNDIEYELIMLVVINATYS